MSHVVKEDKGTRFRTDTPQSFEDTSFVTGDSPVTLDVNSAFSPARNATRGYVKNDGQGNFTVSFSAGSGFGDEITVKKHETLEFREQSVNSIRITWVADSAYRVAVI